MDLVITSPPYNIGTRYLNDPDIRPLDEYRAMLDKVFGEVARVLKPEGVVVIETADSVYFDGCLFGLAAAIADMFRERRFRLLERHINFVKSHERFEQPENNWSREFVALGNSHSNVHHILVLSRTGESRNGGGRILYENYPGDEEGHPCPSNPKIIEFILEQYFISNACVLDPFMGTARLGEAVIRRGGHFYGYEIQSGFFQTALSRLRSTQTCTSAFPNHS